MSLVLVCHVPVIALEATITLSSQEAPKMCSPGKPPAREMDIVRLVASGTVHCMPLLKSILAPVGGLQLQLDRPMLVPDMMHLVEFHMLSV